MDMVQTVFTTCLKDEVATISAWDAFNGTQLCRYRGGGSCSRHGLSSSGGYLLTCEQGKPILHAWPFNKQHCDNKRLIAPGKVGTIAFSEDSSHIALTVDEKVFLYQTVSGKQLGIGSKHFQPINVIKFCEDGSLLSCGGEDGLVTVWNISVFCLKESNPEPLYAFSEHTLPVSDLLFSSGNTRSRVISASLDRTCKIYDLVSGKVLLSLVFDVQLSSLALLPVETDLYIGNTDGGIHEFSLMSPPRSLEHHLQHDDRLPVFKGHEKSITCLSCTVDCCHIISGSNDETIKIWHIKSRQCLRTILQKGPVTNILHMILPKSAFGHDFQPYVFIHDFVNPINVDENEEPSFEIMITEDLMPPVISSNTLVASSGSEVDTLKLEIDKLKSINNAMFSYAVNRIIQKDSVTKKTLVPVLKTKKDVIPVPKKANKKKK